MIEIKDDKIIINLSDQSPEDYLTNLTDALFDILIEQSKAGGDNNPDHEGKNAFILEFLKASRGAKRS